MLHIRSKQHGFTIIELLVVVIIIGILSALVISTYSGVQAKNRNSDRQAAIDTLQSQLETYYAQYNKYPTLANVNDATWRKDNLVKATDNELQDPSWTDKNKTCNLNGKAIATVQPTDDCYAYQVTGTDGSACDNVGVMCAQYTLTAMLEGGGKYVKSSLN